jgi:hypothetical protein
MNPAYLIVRLIGALALGTMLLLFAAIVFPAAFFDLPRLVLIGLFYGAGWMIAGWAIKQGSTTPESN